MGWGADVLVAVRGPVRDVDLFRHRFQRFWEAFDDYSCKRAWMRVHYRSKPPPSRPSEWWWLEPSSHAEAEQAAAGTGSLMLLAARQYDNTCSARSMMTDLLRLPEELRVTILVEKVSAHQLGQLLLRLGPDNDDEDDDEMEIPAQGTDLRERAALAKTVDRLIAESVEGELLYQACLRKETLEGAIGRLAPSFPRLTIVLLAVPECWAGMPIERVHMGAETVEPGLGMALARTYHETFHLDDARDLCHGEWRPFAFDVLHYDHEFEWGLDEPCPCDGCLLRRTAINKNREQAWSSAT